MERVFYILTMMFFFVGCTSTLYPEYILIKKHPQTIPNLELKFLTDTTGVAMHKNDKSIKQDFGFVKRKRHFLVTTYIDESHNLLLLKKGDTIIHYKKEIYI